MDENQGAYPPPPPPPVPPVPEAPAAPAMPTVPDAPAAAPAPDVPAAPPAYAPPVPPYQPPTGGVPAAEPPKKKSKTLIIVLVIVGVLLLCCVGSVVGGLLIFRSASDEIVNDLETELGTDIADDAVDVQETRDPAWDAFDPAPYDTAVYQPLSARNEALLAEIHPALFPGFTIEEAVCEPGSYDGETYWMDNVYVRATLDSDPDVRIVYPVWIQLEEGQADGSSSTDPASLAENEVLDTTADGTEYLYYDDLLPGLLGGDADPDLLELMAQSQADFPDSYVGYAEVDGDDGYVTITRWNAYPDYLGGFDLTYARGTTGWEYVSSEEWSD